MIISNLNRDYLFKKYSQKDIFSAYGCPITNGLFVSPLRIDKTPTCKLLYNWDGTIIYIDNRPGEFRGDCIQFVRKVKNLSYKEALLDIFNTMNNSNKIIPSKTSKLLLKKPSSVIKLNFKDFTDEELDYWKSYGISLSTLNHFNVKSVKNCYIKNKYDEWFDCRKNNELCFAYIFPDYTVKVYFPDRKEYRFISNTTAIQGLSQLDNPEYVVITKSMKDIMCLFELGIPAVAPQTESIIPSDIIDTFDKTYLFYDNDIAGRKATIKVRNKHPEIPILLIPQNYKVKDISDFRKVYGEMETKNLIKYTKCMFV